MNRDDVIEGLRGFLADVLDLAPESITENSTLFDDLDVDSLSVLELAVYSEDHWDVDLEPVLRDANTAGERSEVTIGWLADRITAAASGEETDREPAVGPMGSAAAAENAAPAGGAA